MLTFLQTPAVAAFTNAGTLSTLQFLNSFGESELQLLRVEADFFGIEGLAPAVDEQLAQLPSRAAEPIFAGDQTAAPTNSRGMCVLSSTST